MCRNCGSIIGAGQKDCAVCGASVTNSAGARTSRPGADNETLRFARAVLDRPYKFTIILLIANIFVFLLMWQSSGMTSVALWNFPEQALWAFGAKLNSAINEQHQWWRFVTPMFVHVNLPHLLINMYSLWVVGPYVEKLYGSAKFVVFWVVTGVAGVVASYLTLRPNLAVGPGRFLFKNSDVLSAGASGALFGLVGVLFVFGIKFRHELPEGFRRAFGTGLLPMIMLNLFIGYVGRGFIDNAAHLGGLVSGAILAFAVDYRRPGERSGMAITWHVLRIAAIALVAIGFWMTAKHFRDPLPAAIADQAAARFVEPNNQKFVVWAKAMNAAQDAFFGALKEGDVTNSDSAVKDLENAPSLDPKADELREGLKALLIKSKELKAPVVNSNQPSLKGAPAQLKELARDFELWSKEYNNWLKTTGRTYGLVEVPEAGPAK